jgi:thiol:disulfide interchange protein DsbD
MVEPTYKFSFNVTEAQVGDTVEVLVKVTPPMGWHVYSTRNGACEISPMLASLELEKDSSFKRIGSLVPIGDKSKNDAIFECKVWYFEGVALFKQKIVILSQDLSIKAEFNGQMCNDEACIALFPDIFEIIGITIGD